MSNLINPIGLLSPDSFSTAGTQISITASVMNRPSYIGKPEVSGLTSIYPKILINRPPSGVLPFHICVSAEHTTHDGLDGSGIDSRAFQDLDYRWNFGDPSGTEYFVDYYNNKIVNANDSQVGPIASYMYRNTGEYNITLTVTGKDENGNLISAETSSITSMGEHYIYLGGSTSGTFNLEFNGQTTEPIEYSGTPRAMVSALRSLSGINETNCEHDYYGVIRFFGNLLGTNYNFNIDSTNLSGVVRTPTIINESISNEYGNTITVFNQSGLTTQYFDSNYDGSNGVSDGTISRPYTTFDSLRTYLQSGGNRAAYLKAGSTFNQTEQIVMSNNGQTVRVDKYGEGNNPVILQAVSGEKQIRWNLGFYETLMSDYVISNIEIDKQSYDHSFYLLASSNGITGYRYNRLEHVVFDNVRWVVDESITASSPRFFSYSLPDVSTGEGGSGSTCRGSQVRSVHIWGTGCYLNANNSVQLAVVNICSNKWMSIVGANIGGGSGSLTFDHTMYLKPYSTSLVRYYKSFDAYKNFSINVDCPYKGRKNQYVLVDGSDLGGAQMCIDFSNNSNSFNDVDYGYWDNYIVQFSKLNTGGVTHSQIGLYSVNMKTGTVRYNNFWKCGQTPIAIGPHTTASVKPKLYVYYNRFYGGQIGILGSGIGHYWKYNSHFANQEPDSTYWGNPRCFYFQDTQEDISLWEADHNLYFSSYYAEPFNVSWSGWQAVGNDLNGQVINPNWHIPQSGQFIKNPTISIEWPSDFTNLEYNSSSYNNSGLIDIGDTLTSYSEYVFIGETPTPTGNYNIILKTNSESIDIDEESYLILLNGILGNIFYILKFNNLYYPISTNIIL